jgi:hypothetical protein
VGRGDYYGVSGTPTVYFDGADRIIGSNPPPYDRYHEVIAREIGDSSMAALRIDAIVDPATSVLTTTVTVQIADDHAIPEPGDCIVRALLWEDRVESNGQSFDHVGRDVVLEQPLPVSEGGDTGSVSQQFVLLPAWKLDDLRVVAWIQRESSKDILNAAGTDLRDLTPTKTSSWGSTKGGFIRR